MVQPDFPSLLAHIESGAISMARILVVDDDDLLREFLTVRLAVSGHSVAEAGDGLTALDCIVAGNFELILLDDMMPGLSGWEVLEALQKLPLRGARIVLMSQMVQSTIAAKAARLGAAQCLHKPFCADELIAFVDALCDPPAPARGLKREIQSALASAALFAAAISTTAHAQIVEPGTPIATQSDSSNVDTVSDDKAREPVTEKWTIGASHQWSWISNKAQPEWHETQFGVEYAPDKASFYTLEVSRSSRFSQTDHLATLRGDWRIARNASAYVGAAASPEGNFREKWSLRAGGGVGLGNGIELSADSRISHYASGTKFSLNPQMGVSFADERIALSSGWINLWESGGKHYQGWSARLRVKPDDRLRLFAGLARYPEVETGTTLKVRSAYGGLSFRASGSLEASASYARDKYENAFSRKAVTFELRWKLGNDP